MTLAVGALWQAAGLLGSLWEVLLLAPFLSGAVWVWLGAGALLAALVSLTPASGLAPLLFLLVLAPAALFHGYRGGLVADMHLQGWGRTLAQAVVWVAAMGLCVNFALASTQVDLDAVVYLAHAAACGMVAIALFCLAQLRMRVNVVNLALLFLVTLCSLFLLELAARRFLPPPPLHSSFVEPHPKALFALQPSTDGEMVFEAEGWADELSIPVHINRYGLRGIEIEPEKRPGEYRILCIGDSYTFGWGGLEENTFALQLQQRLGKSAPWRRVRVLNAGVGGYGPWQSRVMLQERLLALKPDMVILQTFSGNDLGDTLLREGRVLDAFSREWYSTVQTYSRGNTVVFRLNRFLRVHSHLYRALESGWLGNWALVRAYARIRWLPSLGLPDPPTPVERLWMAEADLKEWYPALEDAYALLRDDVAGIREDCRAHGIPLVAFNIPWQSTMVSVPMNELKDFEDLYDFGKGAKKVEELLREQADHFVPMAETFATHPAPTTLTFKLDGHFTRAGNAVLAERLEQALLPLLESSALERTR